MTFKGINLRQSVTHPTAAADGSDDTYWSRTANEVFPTATRGAFSGGFGVKSPAATYGFEGSADRDGTGLDPRLAGICTTAGSVHQNIFLVTLPNGPGTYKVRMAAGDRLAARGSMTVTVKDGDGGTQLHQRVNMASSAANNYVDINGTNHTAANWPANNTTATLTFTSSVAAFEFGADFYLNHIAFEQVVAGPTISAHPSNQSVSSGAGFSFSVTAAATGGGTLSYQWQKNGSNISGATSSTYSGTAGTDGVNGDVFRCGVTETGGTNAGGPVYSNTATLTVTAGSVKSGLNFFRRNNSINL